MHACSQGVHSKSCCTRPTDAESRDHKAGGRTKAYETICGGELEEGELFHHPPVEHLRNAAGCKAQHGQTVPEQQDDVDDDCRLRHQPARDCCLIIYQREHHNSLGGAVVRTANVTGASNNMTVAYNTGKAASQEASQEIEWPCGAAALVMMHVA